MAVDGETAAEGAAGRADDTGETMRVGGSGVHGGGKRGREGGSVRGEEGQRGGRTRRLEAKGEKKNAEMDENSVVVPFFSTCHLTLRRCLPIAVYSCSPYGAVMLCYVSLFSND